MRVCEFGHAVREVANRYYFNIGGQVEELSPQRSTGTVGPRTGEGPSGGRHNASAQPNQIEIRCGWFVIDEHPLQPVAQLTRKQVT